MRMSEKFEVVFLNVFGCTKGKKWDCEMMGDGEGDGGQLLKGPWLPFKYSWEDCLNFHHNNKENIADENLESHSSE